MFHFTPALKPIVLAGAILLMFANVARSTANAQDISAATARDNRLPDAPQPVQVTSQSEERGSPQTGTGSISGTVLDANGDVMRGGKLLSLANRAPMYGP